MSSAAEVALAALGDPVRRRVMEILAAGEQSVGALHRVLQRDLGISQPAVSQHLRVLRDAGLVAVRPDGNRRLHRIDQVGVSAARTWLDALGDDPLGAFQQPLDALAPEVARGRRRSAESPDARRSRSA